MQFYYKKNKDWGLKCVICFHQSKTRRQWQIAALEKDFLLNNTTEGGMKNVVQGCIHSHNLNKNKTKREGEN